VAEAGGRHFGFLRQRLGKTTGELLSEAKTLRQRAAEHQEIEKLHSAGRVVRSSPRERQQVEAKQAKETAAAKRGSAAEGFEVGRSEALAEALHTWANQLQTFGLDVQLNGMWDELRAFLTSEGY
jgi:hypothetical protein